MGIIVGPTPAYSEVKVANALHSIQHSANDKQLPPIVAASNIDIGVTGLLWHNAPAI